MSERQSLATPGSWVQIRDPRTLKSGEFRRVQRAIHGDVAGEAAQSMFDEIAKFSVEAWSLQLPVPSQDGTALDLMEIADYRKLEDLLQPVQEALFPTPVEETPQQTADEASPTEPSAAS